MNDLEERHTWLVRKGNKFTIELFRWTVGDSVIWNIYAYIYPDHPRFVDVPNKDLHKYFSDLPFHGGITSARKYLNEAGETTSIKIGCDYNHAWDDLFRDLLPTDFGYFLPDIQSLYSALS